MTGHDAVLVVGLSHFAVRCKQRGECVTPLAVEKVIAMARVIGVRAQWMPQASGVEVDAGRLERARSAIEEANLDGLLQRLDILLLDLTACVSC